MRGCLSVSATVMPETKAYGNYIFREAKPKEVSFALQGDHICYSEPGLTGGTVNGQFPTSDKPRRCSRASHFHLRNFSILENGNAV
jgi:hypothetical protein